MQVGLAICAASEVKATFLAFHDAIIATLMKPRAQE